MEKQIAALSCAIAILEGTAGGYSSQEKTQAKMTLLEMLHTLELEWIASKTKEQS